MSWHNGLAVVVLCAVGVLAWRVAWLARKRAPRRPDGPLCTAAILGSGGHTAEMLEILHALPRDTYTPRIYLATSGDRLSLQKARDADGQWAAHPMQGLCIPRARVVHQSWATTPFTLAWSVAYCAWHLGIKTWGWRQRRQRRAWADVVVMNGPATCVPVVLAIWLMRIVGAPTPRMLYMESYARVTSLSLSARILRHMVDQFVVQWRTADPTAACYGPLI